MSYPKTLSYGLSRLNGYSTQLLKIRCNQNDTARAGQVISFDLPYNSVVDLESIRFLADVTTTGFAHLRHSEGLIRSIFVESGGQQIAGACDSIPQLWNVMSDFMLADKSSIREVYCSSAAPGAVPTAALTGKEVFVSNFMGFLGSASPRFIDTSILPNGSMRVSFRLADLNSAFVGGGATALTDYVLTNMALLVRVCDIQDGLYYSIINERLQSGAGIEIPFQQWYSFNGGDRTGTSASLLFSISSQSVDMLIGFIAPANAVTSGATANTGAADFVDVKNACYYLRGATGVNTSTGAVSAAVDTTNPTVQWKINSVAHPNFGSMTAREVFSETLASLNLLQDTVGACNPQLTSTASWENHFFVSAYTLAHPNPDGTLLSGMNSLGTNGQGEFIYAQTGSATFVPMVFVGTTAVLRVGAGRTLSVTY